MRIFHFIDRINRLTVRPFRWIFKNLVDVSDQHIPVVNRERFVRIIVFGHGSKPIVVQEGSIHLGLCEAVTEGIVGIFVDNLEMPTEGTETNLREWNR